MTPSVTAAGDTSLSGATGGPSCETKWRFFVCGLCVALTSSARSQATRSDINGRTAATTVRRPRPGRSCPPCDTEPAIRLSHSCARLSAADRLPVRYHQRRPRRPTQSGRRGLRQPQPAGRTSAGSKSRRSGNPVLPTHN